MATIRGELLGFKSLKYKEFFNKRGNKMKAYKTDEGYWIAEGHYWGRFIIVEGTTRKEAIKGWEDVAEKI